MALTNAHDLVVLPVGPTAVLHRLESGRVVPVCELGPWSGPGSNPRANFHRISDSGRRIASILGDRLLTRALRDGAYEHVDERVVPSERIYDLRFHGERLFLAGWFDLAGTETAVVEVLASGYVPLSMPEEAAWKHVDALVTANDRLIAVDDLIWPRWLYDWTLSPTPILGTVTELVLVTPNARVVAATRVGRHLCVLERSMHKLGYTWALGIFDAEDLKLRRRYISSRFDDAFDRPSRKPRESEYELGNLAPANTLASDPTPLWISAGRRGIGAVDLSDLDDVAPIDATMSRREQSRALSRRHLPEIRYHAPPPGFQVVGLATVPDRAGCFALIAEEENSPPTAFAWYSAERGYIEGEVGG